MPPAPRFVLHDDRLIPALAKILREEAREGVGSRCSSEGRDDLHRPLRPFLRERGE
jgi:hypothetical protein